MKKLLLSVMLMTSIVSCQEAQKEAVAQDTKNATVETILSRRSIRSYKPEQISEGALDTIINCAINAPSARNMQPWEVRVVQDPELLQAVTEGFKASTGNPDAKDPFFAAPTVVFVAYQKENFFGQLDCGWLGQNILLAAESMNIGTCVVGGPVNYLNSPDAKDIVAKLNFSDGYEILYTIAMGYKNESPDAKPRDAGKVEIIKK